MTTDAADRVVLEIAHTRQHRAISAASRLIVTIILLNNNYFNITMFVGPARRCSFAQCKNVIKVYNCSTTNLDLLMHDRRQRCDIYICIFIYTYNTIYFRFFEQLCNPPILTHQRRVCAFAIIYRRARLDLISYKKCIVFHCHGYTPDSPVLLMMIIISIRLGDFWNWTT